MKLAIVGSRTFHSLTYMEAKLKELGYTNKNIDLIISGGADGADYLAEQYAKNKNIPTEIITSLKRDQAIYYMYRNVEIVTKADAIVAFWNGQSKGTNFVINYARMRKKTIHIVEVK